MTTGTSEFVDALREEVIRAAREVLEVDGSEGEVLAERIEERLRAEFGARRVYVPSLAADRRAEALRLMDQGVTPEDVALRLDVTVRTVQRWRASQHRRRRRDSSGLGRDDWAL